MRMADTLLRQLAMLSLLPRWPRRIDAASIRTGLEARNFSVTLRSIQRDLDKLSRFVPIVSDGSKPLGWSWAADAKAYSLPALDPQAALVFKLVEGHLVPRAIECADAQRCRVLARRE